MFDIIGKYGKASVTIDDLDNETISQIIMFLNHPLFTNNIAIMPDAHAGKGAVVGFTMPITNGLIPNVVGVDINCGMLMSYFGKNLLSSQSLKDIDNKIRQNIPIGEGKAHNKFDKTLLKEVVTKFFNDCNKSLIKLRQDFNNMFGKLYDIKKIDEYYFKELCKKIDAKETHIYNSIGTLGGGNHFIELLKDSNNEYIFVIHSGSRNLGARICTYHQNIAKKMNYDNTFSIEEIKKTEHDKTKWQNIIETSKNKYDKIPNGLNWLEDKEMFDYLVDMSIASCYASVNRYTMMKIISNILDIQIDNSTTIETVHNFIDYNDFIIRKGAVNASKDRILIIPLNNEDGILLCKGLGNKDWNNSAPHGAGRVGPRSKFKDKKLSQDALNRMKLKNIYSSNIPPDETKSSYKDPNIIKSLINGTTVEIIEQLRPILNIK